MNDVNGIDQSIVHYAEKRLGIHGLDKTSPEYIQTSVFIQPLVNLETMKRNSHDNDVRQRCSNAITRLILSKSWYVAALNMGR